MIGGPAAKNHNERIYCWQRSNDNRLIEILTERVAALSPVHFYARFAVHETMGDRLVLFAEISLGFGRWATVGNVSNTF